MYYDLTNFASDLYIELGSPSGLCADFIQSWLLVNVGTLNNLIDTNYSGVNGQLVYNVDGTLYTGLGYDEASIYKEIYLASYYKKASLSNLGATAYDWSEITDGDSTIRRVSRNEVAKNYQALYRQSQLNLTQLVGAYKMNRAHPRQVVDSGVAIFTVY